MNKYSQVVIGPYSKLSQQVYDLIEQPQRVFFSMYDALEEHGDDFLVQYPNLTSPEPVINGNVKLVINDESRVTEPATSRSLDNPTWKVILNEINEMLRSCNPQTGFLEDIVPLDAGTYEVILH